VSEFTPHFLELVAEAAHKSFWRKRALRAFLRRCGISEGALATWSDDESKRDFLDRIFPVVEKHTHGSKVLTKMARYLAEQTSFPDLEGWEDADLKKKQAWEAVGALKNFFRVKEEEASSEKEKQETRHRANELRERGAERQQTLAKLAERLDQLASEIGTQDAGYRFQDWYYDMLDHFEAFCRRPYVVAGRQIDGSVTVDGTTYLNELKFTREQAGAPDVDVLHKKVHDKSDNTMGIMVSMSGYSKPATDGASGPRGLILLLDYSHLYLLLTGAMSFSELITRIRRHSSQTGEAYLPVSQFGG
jgi:uncharacterized protein YukE